MKIVSHSCQFFFLVYLHNIDISNKQFCLFGMNFFCFFSSEQTFGLILTMCSFKILSCWSAFHFCTSIRSSILITSDVAKDLNFFTVSASNSERSNFSLSPCLITYLVMLLFFSYLFVIFHQWKLTYLSTSENIP